MANCFLIQNSGSYGNSNAHTEEGVVINGVRWATRNVDTPGTFAPTPTSAGMFFQWNRRQGWRPGGVSGRSPADRGVVTGWDSSIPTGTTNWTRENNPCPQGWRVPTENELRSLVDAGSAWVSGGRLFGTAPNQIFLPAAGSIGFTNGVHHDVGTQGRYFSSTSHYSRLAMRLIFGTNRNIGVAAGNRASGYSIRCVAE